VSVLDQIVAGVLEDLATRQEKVSLNQLKDLVSKGDSALDIRSALSGPDVAIIAEIKRASPSRGKLAEVADPATMAAVYASGGAALVSVLTEARRFGGSIEDLDEVRAEISIPVLRKDFLLTPYQVWESRAHGADVILLIVAALDQERLVELLGCAQSLGMQALVEAHTADEIDRALDAGALIIGINTRNLKTLQVDRDVFSRLASRIPSQIIRVAESGVRGPLDVLEYARAGADAVLVGEALVIDREPERLLAELVAAGRDGKSRPLGA
jgi:indole-3-glycerol phosphate synthase